MDGSYSGPPLAEPYPDQSPGGPMVMLTNEHAGSDGDVVSQLFKAMGLVPLISRRTAAASTEAA